MLLTWQALEGNEWLEKIAGAFAAGREPRIPPPGVGPFALSEPDRIRAVLDEAGYRDVQVVGNEAPIWFGADAADAYEFILGLNGWMLDGLDDAGRAVALDALRATTAAHQTADGVTFASATWITTARPLSTSIVDDGRLGVGGLDADPAVERVLELVLAQRLREVVVEAVGERDLAVALHRPGAEPDDRHVAAPGWRSSARISAVAW